ncbi:MAG TPA: hypothetical protein VD926_12435, partial [Acidimicrobiales bacterium]|nr:hypothetical protein [Acidimicrobiales bacterium]
GAHNVDGAARLAETLAEGFAPQGRLVVVIGLLGGRDPVEMLRALGAERAARVVACAPPSPRAIPPEELAAAAATVGVEAEVVPAVRAAVQHALALVTPDDALVVTGSLYVVGAARGLWAAVPG